MPAGDLYQCPTQREEKVTEYYKLMYVDANNIWRYDSDMLGRPNKYPLLGTVIDQREYFSNTETKIIKVTEEEVDA